ncbi:MAG: hypothetical protein HQK83_09935 [Fibrobacteria bacterium]|nr:hypothetical protein [Fibrobacteria bacterium]
MINKFLLLLFTFCMLFTACLFSEGENEEVAGGEDFPNTFSSALVNNLNSTEEWKQLDSVPKTLPISLIHIPVSMPGLDSSITLQKPTTISLGKSTASTDKDSIITKTHGDTLFVFTWRVTNNSSIQDTSVILITKENDSLLIQFYGTTYFLSTGERKQNFFVKDADGDNIIDARPGQTNTLIVQTTTYQSNFERIDYYACEAGKDNIFTNLIGESDDRIIFSYHLVIKNQKDSLEFTQWVDEDGDGYISSDSSASSNKVRMTYFQWEDKLIFPKKAASIVIIDAGKDLDFKTVADNQIVFFQTSVISYHGDTLETTQLSGSELINLFQKKSTADSIIIDMKQITHALIPERKERLTRMVVFPGDSTKNYPLKLFQEKFWKTGRREELSITGTTLDSCITLKDTVLITITNYPVATDKTISKRFTFAAGLGEDIALQKDNMLYYFTIDEKKRTGNESTIHFAYLPDTPLSTTDKPDSGALELLIDYTDSTRATATATLSTDSLHIKLITRTGDTLTHSESRNPETSE